ncbi:MAG: polyprenyl synthetase family protein [Polyangiales bacterium]
MTHDLARAAAALWPSQEARFESLLAGEPDACDDLLAAARHQVVGGGKRLRAALPTLALRALVPSPSPAAREAALWAGLAVELVHAATLCHDDVMDGDHVRRGRPSVWARFGAAQAINAGDLLFYLADEALRRAALPPDLHALAAAEHAAALRRAAHGQGAELALRRDGELPTPAAWERIARGKSGALFALALTHGAACARVDGAPDRTPALRELGLSLGALFQLQDDLVDLLGDKGRDRPACDLWEGKPSWLAADCAARLPPRARERFRATLAIPREEKVEADVRRLRAGLDAAGSAARGLAELDARCDAVTARVRAEAPALASAVEALVARIRAPLGEAARRAA